MLTDDDVTLNLLAPFARNCTPVEARLLAQALSYLRPGVPELTFQLAFDAVLPGSNAGGRQYAELAAAQTRLVQPVYRTTLRQGQRVSQAIPLFTALSVDEDTALITGEFNPELATYWWQLAGSFANGEREGLRS